ncbi:hypothetical protein GS982_01375 [Rhodococcus hoagii]|uniref:Uncharacterized protein n=1 Tax=Rhodococcus hoagii TaxID=43767 RepID=A0A9Q4ZII2_RHOHA|nr:hypothetical protein [Prescottella equi]NKT77258.1 hypothetical protein [Prescottella equi]NKZ81043.1 hypothetical protein [Prescottella equi]
MIPIILHVGPRDLGRFTSSYPQLKDVHPVSVLSRTATEGLRVNAVYATPEARFHDNFAHHYRILERSMKLGRNPRRVL